jgi:hypothetical protein
MSVNWWPVTPYHPVFAETIVFLLCFIVDRDQIMAQTAQRRLLTPLPSNSLSALQLLLVMPITPRVC